MNYDINIKKLSIKDNKIYKIIKSSYNLDKNKSYYLEEYEFNNYYFSNNKLKFLYLKELLNKIDKYVPFEDLYKSLTKYNKNIFDKVLKSNKIQFDNISKLNNSNKEDFIKFFNKDNFMKLFNIKLKINKLFISKVNSYFSKNYIDYINDYYDFITSIKDIKCIPFWNNDIQNIANNLFLPIEDNLLEVPNNNIFNYKNWFDFKQFVNKNNNSQSIEINKNRFYKKNKIKCHKIKIFFNKIQRIVINKMYGIYRYFYNRAIQYINNYNKLTNKTFYLIDIKNVETKIEINLLNISNKFTQYTMTNLLKSNYPLWIDIEFPSHLIDKAFGEASDNYNKCMKKYNKYHIDFKLKPKTKKNKFQTINIEKTMISKDRTSLFTKLKYQNEFVFRNLKFSQNLKKYNICDSSITYDTKLNEFYLNLNHKNNFNLKKNKLCLQNKKVCSIDPGNRCFLTVYSDNTIEQIGLNITEKIHKTCKEIDIINSKIYKKNINPLSKRKYKHTKNSRRNMKKAMHRKIKYLKNIKDELHNKAIKFLTDNYAKIILPPFEIQKMSSKFNSKISRALYNLSFYTFKIKLEKKCIEKDIELVIRPEYYTSKTCTKCGNIKHDLGSAEIYKCNSCNIIIGRDIAASRNIMLRNHNF